MTDSYDFIVVGAGAAGCLMANRLSASAANRVLLLEAGPSDDSCLIRAPLGALLLYHNEKYLWKFWSEKEPGLNGQRVYCPQGKAMGGGSVVNGLIYVRGNARDYDHWRSLGNKGWGYDEMLRAFKSFEANEDICDEYHSTQGEVNIQSIREPHAHAERLVLAGLQAGYPYNPDFNGATQEGIGLYQVACKDRRRVSAASAFLHPVRHRSNLSIALNARATQILFDSDRATGVRYHSAATLKTAVAEKEVIVCAGSFNSPKLLLLSGIGAKDELHRHGITLVKDLPGVGRNLQEHVNIVISTRSKVTDTLAIDWRTGLKLIPALYAYRAGRAGLLSKPLIEAGGFIRSSADQDAPDIQLQAMCWHYNDHGFDRKVMEDYGYSMHVTLVRPKSRGRVSLRSASHTDDPVINLNLLEHEDDVRDLSRGLRKAREILRQDAYRRHRGEELYPGERIQSDRDVAAMLRQKARHVFHPAGTCKMGNDDLAVVDEQLRVHGIPNLRVVDASIMPTITSGNTGAPAMAIAAKGAALILDAHAVRESI